MNPDRRVRYALYTDIARSSFLSERHEVSYLDALARHNELVATTVAQYGGNVYKQLGDGFIALFNSADDCVACACQLQQRLGQLPEVADGEPLQVRIVAHGGELVQVGAEFFGTALNRASRICQVCNAGQVIVSQIVADACAALPPDATLADLGAHHLRDLAEPEHLYQLRHPGFARQEFPPLATLESRPNNLVKQPCSFIGRERELSELADLLGKDQRLISIIAPGGYGKSRLAAQLCANLLGRYSHGIFMVLLAPLRDHGQVVNEIARAQGFQFSGSRDSLAQLLAYLRPRQLLLCLDNFEHVLGAAELVAQILGGAPDVSIVITSREPLRLREELIYRLDPLALVADREPHAGAHSEAELLFADRAQLVNPSLVLDEESAPLIASICSQLSGIPLAIELAAAWTDSLTLKELRDELEQWLELESRAADVPLRHRSLRACLDWSWQLLGREQQQLLMQVSAFRGGFYPSAAAEMLGLKGLQLRLALAKLVDKSWLYSREVGGQIRYFMRDMLAHEYAFAKLQATSPAGSGEDQPPADGSPYQRAVMAHARYFSGLLERAGPGLHSSRQQQALSVLGLELQNSYEALNTLQRRIAPDLSDDDEVAQLLLSIMKNMYEYLAILGSFRDMQQLGSQLLERSEQHQVRLAFQVYALLIGAQADHRLGRIEEARRQFNSARRLAEELGDLRGLANTLQGLGNAEYVRGTHDQARQFYEQARDIFTSLNYRPGVAAALGNLGNVDFILGDFDAARAKYAESLELRTTAQDSLGMGDSYYRLANVEHIQGDLASAQQHTEQALRIFRAIGNRHLVAFTLVSLGQVAASLDRHDQARDLLGEALEFFTEIGDRRGMSTALVGLADSNLACGSLEAARQSFTESLEICREIGYHRGVNQILPRLASIAYRQDELPKAAALLVESLSSSGQRGNFESICSSLVLAGRCLARQGEVRAGALCLYGVERVARESGYKLDADDRQLLDEGLADVESDGGIVAEERARLESDAAELDLKQLVEFALDELKDRQGNGGRA